MGFQYLKVIMTEIDHECILALQQKSTEYCLSFNKMNNYELPFLECRGKKEKETKSLIFPKIALWFEFVSQTNIMQQY